LAKELRRHGLPSADVVRLLQEMDDHIEDLLAEQGGYMSEPAQLNEQIETRLGKPEVLAAAALANRRHASVFGRHPIFSFVVAPIPLAILTWVAFLVLCFGLLRFVGWGLGDRYVIEGRAVRDWPRVLVHATSAMLIALRFLPPAVVAAVLCWCARRAGTSWRWTLTAISLVAMVAGAFVVQVKLPAEPGQGQLVLGLGLPVHQWMNLIQFLVPIAVGAAYLWGTRNRAMNPLTAFGSTTQG
jgi:hypothetical protein